jgi:hypothetical protein
VEAVVLREGMGKMEETEEVFMPFLLHSWMSSPEDVQGKFVSLSTCNPRLRRCVPSLWFLTPIARRLYHRYMDTE